MDDKIVVTFKTSNGKKCDVELRASMTVQETKEAAAGPCDMPSDQQRLIYRGRILKNNDLLSSYGITTGHTIHLVRSSGAAPAGAPAQAGVGTGAIPAGGAAAPPAGTTQPAAPPAGTAAAPPAGAAAPGLESLFSGGLNPAMFQQVMSSPAMQQMMRATMQNPELLRTIINANPILSQMVQSNPMLGQMLETPEVMNGLLDPVLGANNNNNNTRAPANNPQGEDINDMLANMSQLFGGGPSGNSMQQMLQRLEQNPEAMQNVMSMAQEFLGNERSTDLSTLLETMASGTGNNRVNNGPLPADAAERWATQLTQLQDMGFIDRDANLLALQQSNGDVNAAIAWLLESGFGG